ncbi:endonuclease [Candidatus Woesearchaeota archaeon]|nr:endonuclease [Candidatus Woesearchaeota archaeon]
MADFLALAASLLAAMLVLLLVILYRLSKKLASMQAELVGIASEKKSLEVKHGSAWEKFVPFMKGFPYDKTRFRFLGTPIDGIAFEDDKIVFVEIKTGKSKLNNNQHRVKELVEKKKVEFDELRF